MIGHVTEDGGAEVKKSLVVLCLDMKTKLVENVPRTNIKQLAYDIMTS